MMIGILSRGLHRKLISNDARHGDLRTWGDRVSALTFDKERNHAQCHGQGSGHALIKWDQKQGHQDHVD